MQKQRGPASVMAAVFVLLSLVATAARTDRIDDFVRERMKEFSVPSVSMAIVENGKIVKIGSYGLADVARGTRAAPETVCKIGSVKLNDGTATSYGFGWNIQTQKNGRHVVLHGGSLPGFTSQMMRYMNEKVTVIVLTNAGDVDAGGIANGIANIYLADRQQQTAQPTPARGNVR